MLEGAGDEAQLLGASDHERCILTFNIRDFIALSAQVPEHSGILLAAQRSWSLSDLIRTLDRVFTETQGKSWQNQVLWLNRWRE